MITILAVDDMPENLRLVRKLLTPQDFRVLEAPSGEEALAIATAAMPDIVLIDIRLGEGAMTGCELAGRIRKLPRGAAAVLVALSGGAVLDDAAMSRETGFDAFIEKPFDYGEFAGRLKRYLSEKNGAGLLETGP